MIRLVSEGGAAAFRDRTVPLLSFLTGRSLARAIYRYMDIEIEDLWLPFFAISASLTRAEMMVHTRGSAAMAVLASTRAPGVFPPLICDGDVLVDGGLLNNVPVDVMKERANGGKVIAVDVSPSVEPIDATDYGVDISGWRVLWHRLRRNPRHNLPTVFHVLMRIIDFSGVARLSKALELADLYLHIPLEEFKINDFRRGVEMAEVAYQFSKPRIQSWRASAGTPRP